MEIDTFWESSIKDIRDYLESYARVKEREEKAELSKLHFLATDIAQYVNMILSGEKNDKRPMELWDFFPDLFREEKEQNEQAEKERSMALHKAQMEAYAIQFNTRRKKGGGT